ncbi:hypothetical protein FRC16_003992, partial [Serendipita sp. 398]
MHFQSESLGDGLDTLPPELLHKIGSLLSKDDLLSLMDGNRALRAFFAPLLFRNIYIFRQSARFNYAHYWKKHQELTLSTVFRIVQNVHVMSNSRFLEPDVRISLISTIPTLSNLKTITIGASAPFTEGLYLEIRSHPTLTELRISDKAGGPCRKSFSYVKDHPTCRLVYLEAPNGVIEDLLQKGSATAQTIQCIAVVGQPVLRNIHQSGPFPSLRRVILVERASGTFHESFWRFLHAHPDLSDLTVTYYEGIDSFKDRTDPRKSVELRNNLKSISGPYFLIQPLIAATRGSLESVVISDITYRGNLRSNTVHQAPIESQLRKVLQMSFQLTHIQHISIVLHSAHYDLVISEFKALSPNQTIQGLRSFGLVIKRDPGEEKFETNMDKISTSLIGNLSPHCKIMLSIKCKELFRKYNLWFFNSERGDVIRAGRGLASSFHEICPTVMKWAAMPSSFGLDQVEVSWNSKRWFTFKRKVPGMEWSAILTPNGGRILPIVQPEEIDEAIGL